MFDGWSGDFEDNGRAPCQSSSSAHVELTVSEGSSLSVPVPDSPLGPPKVTRENTRRITVESPRESQSRLNSRSCHQLHSTTKQEQARDKRKSVAPKAMAKSRKASIDLAGFWASITSTSMRAKPSPVRSGFANQAVPRRASTINEQPLLRSNFFRHEKQADKFAWFQ